jgi:translocation and assembly module TamA
MLPARPRATPPLFRVCWLLTLAAITASVAPTSRSADFPGGGDGAATAPPAVSAPTPDNSLRYRVVIDAPEALVPLLERAVDLVRWQSFDSMTDDLLDRLAREALAQAREAAASRGYFTAAAAVTIDRSGDPMIVTLQVDPGRPTTVDSVRVTVTGPATTDVPVGAAVVARVQAEWPLPRGEVFRQDAWADAKTRSLSTLTASPYAAATIASSRALVDPETATADLSIELASGPAFRFGDLDIRGLSLYPPSMVRNFNTLRPGDPYSTDALEAFTRRLTRSGYFSSVRAEIDVDSEQHEHATVNVAVIEGPTRRVEVGLGYSTDTKFRANATYSDINVDGRGTQMLIDGRLETKTSSLSLRFTRPPTEGGWLDTYSAGFTRTDIENLVTETVGVGVVRRGIDERDTPSFGIGFFNDRQRPLDATETSSHALYLHGGWTRRRVDQLLAPSRGWMSEVEVGGGIPGASTRSFGRVVGKASAWVPVGTQYSLVLRAEAGAVIADSRDGIPSLFLFRTGGDTTVRGYAFESLGVQDGSATVGGRYYAFGNIEAIRWMGDSWGLAAFVDAGNAADSVTDLSPAIGAGVGLRLRTPIGPFRLDIAYGEQTRAVRMHLSVGLSF